MVTHQISYLYGCDEVIIMEDGNISSHDNPEKLKEKLDILETNFKKEDE